MLRGLFTRRYFISCLGGAAAAWPFKARAQQPAMPVVGFLRSTPATGFAYIVDPFRQGLNDAGFVEGKNVAAELFKMMTGADMPLVSYRSGGPALTDLLGGQVQVMFATSGDVPLDSEVGSAFLRRLLPPTASPWGRPERPKDSTP